MFTLIIVAMVADVATAAVPIPQDPNSVVRCVREDVTGSLARTRRVCHTVGEWRRITFEASREADRVIMPNGVPGNSPK